jgi:zinc protease
VTAPNLVISVAGDFEREMLIERLQPLLESKVRSTPFQVDQTPGYGGPIEAIKLTESLDREQAVLFQAYPDVGVCGEGYIEGELLNELFSGMSSRLFERVRDDKGLAYYVGTTRIVGLQTSLFTFYAGTHPSQVDEVATEIDIEIARVKAGQVTEEELQRCRTRLRAAYVMERQTLEARTLHAGINTAYGLPIENDAEYAQKLEKVSPQSIAAFAKTFLNDQRSVRLVVGP